MIDPTQLLRYVIEPALTPLKLYSLAAGQLLLGTAAAESQCGKYLHQISGPALGIFQMEPATHSDCWDNWLAYRGDLAGEIRYMVPQDMWDTGHARPRHELLMTDLRYAAIMARVKYRRSPVQLPAENDWHGCAKVWKSVYNSAKGAGTELHFMDSLVTCKVI